MPYIVILPAQLDLPEPTTWVMQKVSDDLLESISDRMWGNIADPTTVPHVITDAHAERIRADRGFSCILLKVSHEES